MLAEDVPLMERSLGPGSLVENRVTEYASEASWAGRGVGEGASVAPSPSLVPARLASLADFFRPIPH